MKINKVELAGMGISVAVIAVALWWAQIDNAGVVAGDLNRIQQSGSVIVSRDTNDLTAANQAALEEAMDGQGNLERMVIDDIKIGNGEEVKEGDRITVHYKGQLQNGQEFDNSYKRGEPFTFTVGAGRVIAGWEQGVVGMKTGGERILVIPSHLAYGKKGSGPVPADATLLFTVELLQIAE